MDEPKVAVKKMNEKLQKLQNRGTDLRNEIVIINNKYSQELDSLARQKDENNKNCDKAFDIMMTHKHSRKVYRILANLNIAIFFSGFLVALFGNPILGGGLMGLSMPAYYINAGNANICDANARSSERNWNKFLDKDEEIIEKSKLLEKEYLDQITPIQKEWLEVKDQFFTIRSHKERLVKGINLLQDKDFKDEKSEELNFELPSLF